MPDPTTRSDSTNQGDTAVTKTGSWMSDVQRILALAFVGTFCVAFLMMVGRLVIFGAIDDVVDILKILIPAAITLVTGVVGYFYGSSKSKENAEASQAQLVDKLTSTPPGTIPPTPGTVPPAGTPTPWWSLLTEAEKSAINTLSASDAHVRTIATAMASGGANADDLEYLVTVGVLTADRAAAIKAT